MSLWGQLRVRLAPFLCEGVLGEGTMALVPSPRLLRLARSSQTFIAQCVREATPGPLLPQMPSNVLGYVSICI